MPEEEGAEGAEEWEGEEEPEEEEMEEPTLALPLSDLRGRASICCCCCCWAMSAMCSREAERERKGREGKEEEEERREEEESREAGEEVREWERRELWLCDNDEERDWGEAEAEEVRLISVASGVRGLDGAEPTATTTPTQATDHAAATNKQRVRATPQDNSTQSTERRSSSRVREGRHRQRATGYGSEGHCKREVV